MGKQYEAAAILIVIILAVIGGFLSLLYGTPGWLEETPTAPVIVPTQPPIGAIFFAPPSPQEAPPEIRDKVMWIQYHDANAPVRA